MHIIVLFWPFIQINHDDIGAGEHANQIYHYNYYLQHHILTNKTLSELNDKCIKLSNDIPDSATRATSALGAIAFGIYYYDLYSTLARLWDRPWEESTLFWNDYFLCGNKVTIVSFWGYHICFEQASHLDGPVETFLILSSWNPHALWTFRHGISPVSVTPLSFFWKLSVEIPPMHRTCFSSDLYLLTSLYFDPMFV